MKLTARQREILVYIEESFQDRGYAPTLTELMELTGIETKKGVAFHLDALEKKGYIKRTGEARGVKLISDDSGRYLRVPLIGYANAGEPLIDAKEEFHGELLVDKKLLDPRRPVFGIELRGDSMEKRVMNGVPMKSGNYAIVLKDGQISDGDAVLALINDAATVKSVKREKGMYVLYPESSNDIHKPIYIKDKGSFIGKVVTVLNNPTQ